MIDNLTGMVSCELLQTLQSFPPDKRSYILSNFNLTPDQIASIQSQVVSNNCTAPTDPEKMLQHMEFRLHRMIQFYIPMIIFVVGIVGNCLSFAVLTRSRMRRVSTYAYLAVLSVADSLVLTVGLLQVWGGELTGQMVRDQAGWICKLSNVIGYTVSDYSVWLIIAVTVERYIAVCHPLRAAAMCKRQTAAKVIVGTFVLLLGLNLHFFWTTHVQFIRGLQQCRASEGHEILVEKVWPWLDAMIYSFIPFLIILILNTMIIRRVIVARHNRGMLSNQSPASNGKHIFRRTGTGAKPGSSGSAVTVCNGNGNRGGSTETNFMLSLMLLTISFAFLLMTLPMNIILIVSNIWNGAGRTGGDTRQWATFQLARTITELLMYMNHSTNFFLYCATGQKFRQELCALFGRGRSDKASRMTSSHCGLQREKSGKTVVFNMVSRRQLDNNHLQNSSSC